ncbi:MAG: cob(I)yrinic acid a,c-diamide adenosyltransferase [Muribaculaceae bacterium]|nr:cob(I)yrinic acid a,c-diamide adenosyltransferase [Muribaculaceae bacterium]
MKLYTKTGDTGTTSLVGGTRVSKIDTRLDAYGTVDELNSWLGLILACDDIDESVKPFLVSLQSKLFDLGANLATIKTSDWQPSRITSEDTAALERQIDTLDRQLPQHNRFILPGGSQSAAVANIARTVCRRAERRMCALPDDSYPCQTDALAFVNRLSDYLFVLARYLNMKAHIPETFWEQDTVL